MMDGTTAHALPVLYQDEVLALIDKPAGLMVHDSALARGERDFAADRLRAQFGRPIHLIHRLDRATSGCLLIAFEREVASALGRQFMSQSVDKHYLAVCRGWPAQDAFIVDHPLDGGPGKPEKKPARTAIRVMARGELDEPAAGFATSRYALVECSPQSGRFRQIRRHLKHIHHPLIGDTSHGDGRRNLAFRLRGIHRMLLHAHALRFVHPVSGATLSTTAPLDAAFRKALALFNWPHPDAPGGKVTTDWPQWRASRLDQDAPEPDSHGD